MLHIIFSTTIKEHCDDPDFFLLEQLQQGRLNKAVWVQVVSQFMKPLIHRYSQDVNPGTTNVENYCPVAGEALLFLLLENNFKVWAAESERKDKSEEEKEEMAPLPTPKYSGRTVANGRTHGGWKNAAKIRFNEYVDIIEDFNKNKDNVEAYNMSLKNACIDLKAAKEARNKKRKKPNSVEDELDNTPMRYSLPPGMRMEGV